MKVWSLLVAASLALVGCEAVNEGDPDGSEFTLGSSCLSLDPEPSREDPAASAQRAVPADSSGLQVLFVSADSLHFVLPVTLNCGLKYAFSASLPAPDTLVISRSEPTGTTAKCVCRKELTVRLRAAAGESLDKVKVLKTPSGAFLDFH